MQNHLAEHGASLVTLRHDDGTTEYMLSKFTPEIGEKMIAEMKEIDAELAQEEDAETMRRQVLEEVHRIHDTYGEKLGTARLTLLWRNVADENDSIDWARLERFKERLKNKIEEPDNANDDTKTNELPPQQTEQPEQEQEEDLSDIFSPSAASEEVGTDGATGSGSVDGDVVDATSVVETTAEPDIRIEDCALRGPGFQPPAVLSRIQSEGDFKYWVKVIRTIQEGITANLLSVAAIVADGVQVLQKIDFVVGRDLRNFAIDNLPKGKKSLKTTDGGVFFRKTGGWKVFDRNEVQSFVDGLPEEELADYGVVTVRKWSATTMKELAADGVRIPGLQFSPDNEYGSWGVGATRAWSHEKPRSAIKAALGKLKQIAKSDDEEGEDDSESA